MDKKLFLDVAEIVHDISQIPKQEIRKESHLDHDLGIDSLDMLDIIFAVNKRFSINLKIDNLKPDDYVLRNFCSLVSTECKSKAA